MSDHWKDLADILGTPSLNPIQRKSNPSATSPASKNKPDGSSRSKDPVREVATPEISSPQRVASVDPVVESTSDAPQSNEKTVPPKKRSSWDTLARLFGVGSGPNESEAEAVAKDSPTNIKPASPMSRPVTDRSQADKSHADKSHTEKSHTDRPQIERSANLDVPEVIEPVDEIGWNPPKSARSSKENEPRRDDAGPRDAVPRDAGSRNEGRSQGRPPRSREGQGSREGQAGESRSNERRSPESRSSEPRSSESRSAEPRSFDRSSESRNEPRSEGRSPEARGSDNREPSRGRGRGGDRPPRAERPRDEQPRADHRRGDNRNTPRDQPDDVRSASRKRPSMWDSGSDDEPQDEMVERIEGDEPLPMVNDEPRAQRSHGRENNQDRDEETDGPRRRRRRPRRGERSRIDGDAPDGRPAHHDLPPTMDGGDGVEPDGDRDSEQEGDDVTWNAPRQDGDGEAPRSRRRSGRGGGRGRNNQGERKRAPVQEAHTDDELLPDHDEIELDLHDEDDEPDETARHIKIPTWAEAIDVLVTVNAENHRRVGNQSHGSHRRGGGGGGSRGGGGRSDGGRGDSNRRDHRKRSD